MVPENTQSLSIGSASGHSDGNNPAVTDEIGISPQKIQAVFSDLFQDEKIQKQIQQHLKRVLQEELSKMSVLLRGAIRDWLLKEKQKYKSGEGQQTLRLEEKLDTAQEKNTLLEAENEKLKRQLELKAHENAIFLTGMEHALSRSSQKE